MIGPSIYAGVHAAGDAVANHLWQSTVFALMASLLTLGFRHNHAGIRFGLWLTASVKFLIPFSLLISMGGWLVPHRAAVSRQAIVYEVVERVSQPFTRSATPMSESLLAQAPVVLLVVWLAGSVAVMAFWWWRWRRVSAMARRAELMTSGRELDALHALEGLCGVRRPLALRVSADSMEPAVFGIVRPVLIWPCRFSEQLSDAQLRSILAHELAHVRRRDNLVSALHMVVEALFWFHPAVWWVGARLVEERERACDEAVLRLGNRADVYAEGILNACKFCVESPLSCVSGVAGSNLTRRVNRIMNGQSPQKLNLSRRVVLAAAAVTIVAGPVALGVMRAPQLNAQALQGPNALSAAAGAPPAAFDSVSVKPADPGDDKILIQVGDHTFHSNASIRELIKFAYGIDAYQIDNAPDWASSERYDIVGSWKDAPGYTAKVAALPGPPPPPAPPAPPGAVMTNDLAPFQLQAMVQNVLETKFHLKWSPQVKDMPLFDLVVAGGGAKLTPIPTSPPPPSFQGEPIISVRTMLRKDKGEVTLRNGPVGALAGILSPVLDHQVIDKTGIQGSYDIALHWNPEQNLFASVGQSLEEQLGLKLEAQHGPVKMFRVEQMEKPTAD